MSFLILEQTYKKDVDKMATETMIWIRPLNTVEWVAIKQPSSIQYVRETYDSEDSFRAMNNRMVRDVIGTLIKLELEWPYMTLQELNEILQIIEADFFEVKYFDPYENPDDFTSKIMYAGNRTAPFYNVRMVGGKRVYGVESFSVNFIEQGGDE